MIFSHSFVVGAETIDVIKGKQPFYKNSSSKVDSFGEPLTNLNDGDKDTFISLYKEGFAVYFDLDQEFTLTGYSMDAKIVGGSNNLHIRYFDSNWNVLKDYNKDVLNSDKVKNVRYVSIEYVYNRSIKIYEFNVFGLDGKISNVSNLDIKSDVNSASLSWTNPNEETFIGVNIYQGNEKIATLDKPLNSYTVNGLKDNTSYVFRVTSLDDQKKETNGISKTVKTLIDPKKVPPGPVSSFVAEPTDKTVKLKWKKPIDDDLAGFKILQNGKQVAEIGLEEEFTVKNLKPLTDYTFGVMAVDKDKNDSTPVNLSVKTLEENDDEPPLVPSNVFAKPSNGALIATWDKVSDKDLAGYNVYVDDKKINSNLISSTNFTIKNLENNRKYKIQVQAVDRSGNFSELSLAAYGTPDERTIPIIESKYSLQDISDGVNVMFGQFWLVLAFAVGIPLSFYIIYKLKLTVLP